MRTRRTDPRNPPRGTRAGHPRHAARWAAGSKRGHPRHHAAGRMWTGTDGGRFATPRAQACRARDACSTAGGRMLRHGRTRDPGAIRTVRSSRRRTRSDGKRPIGAKNRTCDAETAPPGDTGGRAARHNPRSRDAEGARDGAFALLAASQPRFFAAISRFSRAAAAGAASADARRGASRDERKTAPAQPLRDAGGRLQAAKTDA